MVKLKIDILTTYNFLWFLFVFITDKRHNFEKVKESEFTTFDLPYDYDSIMHYGNKAFSKNGNVTIVALVSVT